MPFFKSCQDLLGLATWLSFQKWQLRFCSGCSSICIHVGYCFLSPSQFERHTSVGPPMISCTLFLFLNSHPADMPRPALVHCGCISCQPGSCCSDQQRWRLWGEGLGGTYSLILCLVTRSLRTQLPTCSPGSGWAAGSWFPSNSRQDGRANCAPARGADVQPLSPPGCCLEAVARQDKNRVPYII